MNYNVSFWKYFLCASAIAFSVTLSIAAQPNWMVVQKGIKVDFVTVHFTSDNEGWVGGDNGYLAFTSDGGKSWVKKSLGTTENLNEVYFRGDDNGYVLAGKQIFITKDKGLNWRETRVIELSELKGLTPEFLSVRFSSKKRGFIVGSVADKNEVVVDSLVLQTKDGGETWQRVKVPSKTELFHIDFVGDERGWIVGDKGTILVTEDGGETWQGQTSGTDRALRSVDFRNSTEGYTVGSRGTILRTENGGRSWQKIANDSTESFFRVAFADDKTGFIVGRNGSILRTDDKGKIWKKLPVKVLQPLYGLFMDKKFGWAVGASGVVLKYSK